MEIPTGLGDFLGGSAGLLGTAYNLYTNKRDFDYQKALQQTMFEREDNAVQRRVKDLEAAGLNPNLAAGSSANAGSVVARSSTNDVNMGAALDFVQAANNIRLQRKETEIKEKELDQLNFNLNKAQQDYVFDRVSQLYGLGFDPKIAYGTDGKVHIKGENKVINFGDTYLGQQFKYNFDNLKNSAALLQKDVDLYNLDKAMEYITPFLRLFHLK